MCRVTEARRNKNKIRPNQAIDINGHENILKVKTGHRSYDGGYVKSI